MTRRQLTAAQIFGVALTLAWYFAGFASAGSATLPDQLSDSEFWRLSTSLSEDNGYFRSDNLVSNEMWLQHVIPELQKTTKPGRVYLGVGPEQNFTYIANLKPPMAFIVDVRRGNLQLHMMYKALFEMSKDRADFVARLFSRKRPEGLTTASTAAEIFDAFASVPSSEALYKQNLKDIADHYSKRRNIPLSDEDFKGIDYVVSNFRWYGPQIRYSSTGGRGMRGGMASYYDLMALSTDAEQRNRSYLASEENFNVLKALHSKNLIVPVVGNFGGPKALRAVGDYIRERGTFVMAFYLSNVEQYLEQDQIWPVFCRNVATMPIDDSSLFIRSVRGGSYNGFNGGGFGMGLTNTLGNMREETAKYCAQ
jgi:hypothetical protein